MNTIYNTRIELNNWEIIGVEKYLNDTFGIDGFIHSDKTIHFDEFGIYKISHGEDLYITQFNDDKENVTYRLCLGTDTFHHITETFDFIAEVNNIFEV